MMKKKCRNKHFDQGFSTFPMWISFRPLKQIVTLHIDYPRSDDQFYSVQVYNRKKKKLRRQQSRKSWFASTFTPLVTATEQDGDASGNKQIIFLLWNSRSRNRPLCKHLVCSSSHSSIASCDTPLLSPGASLTEAWGTHGSISPTVRFLVPTKSWPLPQLRKNSFSTKYETATTMSFDPVGKPSSVLHCLVSSKIFVRGSKCTFTRWS